MSAVLLLAGYATTLAVLGPLLLTGAAWTARSPRLGIWAWQSLTTTVLLSAVLACLALAFPTAPFQDDLAAVLHACVKALHAQYATPGGTAAAAFGSASALFLLCHPAHRVLSALRRAQRERRRHAEVLSKVGSPRGDLGVMVLDDDRAAVYCLPGRKHRIVLTSAALAALTPVELQAAIQHEQAHVRQRHHLLLSYAEGLRRAFPRLRLFRSAAEETWRLVELAADDAATVRTDPLTLAGALVELAGSVSATPRASLSASGGHVARRVRRLLGPPKPLTRVAACAGALAGGAVLVLPLLLIVQPAAAVSGTSRCPLPAVSPAQAGGQSA